MRPPFLILLASIALLGCGGDSAGALSADDPMTLYSIDPTSMYPGKEKPKGETFQGYAVFGKIENVPLAIKKELATALNRGVSNSDGTMAKCFEPRHGIRSRRGDVDRDYVICFECLQMEVHQGQVVERKAITREPGPVFNKHLTDAGIKIAPPLFERN